MNEFALALKMMTQPHPVRDRLERPAVAIVSKPPAHTLSPAERAALAARVHWIATHATGKIVLDSESGFWVPEVRGE